MTANHEDAEVRDDLADDQRPGRIPADTFSNRLLLARAMAGHLSIREACERTGLNRGNWQGWERGLRPRDQVEVSRLIADALDLDFNWLLFGGPLLPARGRPTKRMSMDSTWNRPVTVGQGGSATRPMSGRPKVRVDRVRPISAPTPGRRANYVETTQQSVARHVA